MADESAAARRRFGRRKTADPGLLPFALAAALITAGLPAAGADEAKPGITALSELVREAGAEPVRFVLASGRTVVGRIVRIDGDALTIRRPSGGLASLLLTDIASVNIKSADGGLLRGHIARLPDGGIGWLADDEGAAAHQLADAGVSEKTETGGPLIRLQRDDVSPETAAVEVAPVAVTPGADDAPADASEPIRLEVTAEEASESDKLIYFRLKLSRPAERSILVIYTMIDGSAAAPADFTQRQGVVVFEPGQTQAAVATAITNDEEAEEAESFTFFVTADPAAVTIEERKVLATINDDDG